MKSRPLMLLLLLAAAANLFSQYKPWYHHFNFSFGSKAMAMGNAFTGLADDLTAVFWNPAGLAAIRGPEFYLGYQTESQSQEYELQDKRIINTDRVLYNYDFSSKLQQINFFSVSAPAEFWKMKWNFALSYYRYIPYGFKGLAQETITYLYGRFENEKTTVTFRGSEGIDVLAFSAAARLAKFFDLGITLQQFFGSGSLHLQNVNPGGEFHENFNENVRGRNVIVGIMLRPSKTFAIGFTFHSGLRDKLDSSLQSWEVNEDKIEVNRREQSALARVAIPAQYSLGASWQMVRWLTLSAESSRSDWRQGTIADYYQTAVILPYPQKTYFATSQKTFRSLRLGLEINLPLRKLLLHLRGGWFADQPLFADGFDQAVRLRGYGGGIGCEFSQSLLLEIAYQRQLGDWNERGFFFKNRQVPSHYRADLLKFSLIYRFGRIFAD